MNIETLKSDQGTIVYDASIVPKITPVWFDPEYWQQQQAVTGYETGRGTACFISTPVGACVLKHYHRGGMAASLLEDKYFWFGHNNTRCVDEFYLLVKMISLHLPVPEPVAVHYVRDGCFYRASLITRQIVQPTTLGSYVCQGEWDKINVGEIGKMLARFHRQGVYHADLNAQNILLTPLSAYLIDFDRACIKKQGKGWQRANLRRLHRSLVKVGATAKGKATAFERSFWQPLLEAYAACMKR